MASGGNRSTGICFVEMMFEPPRWELAILDFKTSHARVEALVAPKNVVIVGASDRPGNWAQRALRNLRRYDFPGQIYLMNPARDEVMGEKCYRDFAALPEPPDHLLIVVPAKAVADVIEQGAAAGARSATVFSSGFGESFDAVGAALGARLRAVIAKTGMGVSGPNCMGNICKPARFVTLTEDRQLDMTLGDVALVGQSGGVMIFVNAALEERGMSARYIITSGNEAGLHVADYVAYFAADPQIKVILVYCEAIADAANFQAACRHARQLGKSVIAMKLGYSEAGREAALAHTGSLAGSLAAFDAMAADAGVIRAETLDDAVELAELLSHSGAAPGRRLGAVTLSGAYRGLLLDAAERNGMSFPALAPRTLEKLHEVLGVGSYISNPIDGGFGVLQSADAYKACMEALHDDPNIDMVLLQEALPRAPGLTRGEAYIGIADQFAQTAKKPVAYVTLASHGQTDYSRALRHQRKNLSFLQEANKALRVIAATARRGEAEALAQGEPPARKPAPSLVKRLRQRALLAREDFALDETQSKALLKAYAIATPREALAATKADAVKLAATIGYPVALKAVSAELLHKSDVGAVALNIAGPKALRDAWDGILGNLQSHKFTGKLAGMLVSEMVSGGVELVLGLHRDAEAGIVVMAGSGGVLLELFKDVAFAAPPINTAKARDMLERTKALQRLRGYRGAQKLDEAAVVKAIVALGRMAEDLSDVLQSVDVNPFVVRARGGVALDGLVVLRGMLKS